VLLDDADDAVGVADDGARAAAPVAAAGALAAAARSAERRTLDGVVACACSSAVGTRPSIGIAGRAADRPDASRETFTAGRISPV
jgi:hypothetical protein